MTDGVVPVFSVQSRALQVMRSGPCCQVTLRYTGVKSTAETIKMYPTHNSVRYAKWSAGCWRDRERENL